MARYLIESVNCEIGEGGMACGPMDGPIVAEAVVKTDAGESFIMGLAEVTGIPNFYKSEKSFFEQQIENDFSDEELDEFQGCFVETGEYDEIFEDQDPEWYQLYRYMIYVVRACEDEMEEFIQDTVGKYVDEMDIPDSDVEEMWEDENYDEENE